MKSSFKMTRCACQEVSFEIVREYADLHEIQDFALLCAKVGCGQVCTACHCDLKRFLAQADLAPAEVALAGGETA